MRETSGYELCRIQGDDRFGQTERTILHGGKGLVIFYMRYDVK